jgi:hypothetical protein
VEKRGLFSLFWLIGEDEAKLGGDEDADELGEELVCCSGHV